MLLRAPRGDEKDEERREQKNSEKHSDQSTRHEELKGVRMRLLDQPLELPRLNAPERFPECAEAGAKHGKQLPGPQRRFPERDAGVAGEVARIELQKAQKGLGARRLCDEEHSPEKRECGAEESA